MQRRRRSLEFNSWKNEQQKDTDTRLDRQDKTAHMRQIRKQDQTYVFHAIINAEFKG